MPTSENGTGRIGIKIPRRFAQVGFLALFVFLTVSAAYPPISTPPANFLLRFDPLAGLSSLAASRTADVFTGYWPAWILLGLTLLSYRFFCAWICPLGTCFDLAGAVKLKSLKYYRPSGKELKALLEERRSGIKPRGGRVKYIVLLLVLVLSLVGINMLYFFSPLVFLNRSVYLILLPQVPVTLIILVLLAFLYRPRFWCEEICPLGALLSIFSLAGNKSVTITRSPVSIPFEITAKLSSNASTSTSAMRNCPARTGAFPWSLFATPSCLCESSTSNK